MTTLDKRVIDLWSGLFEKLHVSQVYCKPSVVIRLIHKKEMRYHFSCRLQVKFLVCFLLSSYKSREE